MSIDDLFDALASEKDTLYDRYLRAYAPALPDHTPDVFEYDVKSYLILFHANFEDFAEQLSERLLASIESEFFKKKVSLATICLINFHGIKIELPTGDDDEDISCFDHVRNAILEAKRRQSNTIKENHGVSPKYLRWLLMPLGVNIPKDVKIDSLKKLSRARGSFAHTMAKHAYYGEYKKAKHVMTPEEAEKIVSDCLSIASDICKNIQLRW